MKRVFGPRASTILHNLLIPGKDDRPWILPANICPIVPITFMKARKDIVFIDISRSSLNLDTKIALELCSTRRYGGILFSHTYGDPTNPEDFFHDLKNIDDSLIIIDDRCLCRPELDLSTENPADVILFSTGYSKIVDIGFGGFAFLKDGIEYQPIVLPYSPDHLKSIENEYKQAIASQSMFSYIDNDWLETEVGTMDWSCYQTKIQNELPLSLERRFSINQVYSSDLPGNIQLPSKFQSWRFNIQVPEKNIILKKIFETGLFASSHFTPLSGIMGQGENPNAIKLSNHVINLFNDAHYSIEMAQRTCRIINEVIHG